MFKTLSSLFIFFVIPVIAKSQTSFKVDHVRIETNNFLTNQYEENSSKDYRALGYEWDIFSYLEGINEITVLNDKKLRNVPEDDDNESAADSKFYILESFVENSKPYIMTINGLTWNIYKTKTPEKQSGFIGLCNFKNDLVVIYEALRIRAFFVCKNSNFNPEQIGLPESIYSLLTVAHIDAAGKEFNSIGLTYNKESFSWNKTEYLYLFNDHVIFNPNHARDEYFNQANKDYYNKLLLNYRLKASTKTNSTNADEQNYTIEEKSMDYGRLVFKPLKNSATNSFTIDYIKANEYLRYTAKKITAVSNITKSDISNYQKVLTSVTSDHVAEIVNSTPNQNREAGTEKDNSGYGYAVKSGQPYIIKGDRKIMNSYPFTPDGNFNKAYIYAVIKVSAEGKGTFISVDKYSTSNDPEYTTAISKYLPYVQFNEANHESIVTVQFEFKAQTPNEPAVRENHDENKIYSKVEIEAGFPGGDDAWRNYIKRNINYEDLLSNGATSGTYTVTVKFIVSKDGSLSDFACESDPGFGMCQEAIRVIKKTKNWTPAIQNGRNVNAYRRQPITFTIK